MFLITTCSRVHHKNTDFRKHGALIPHPTRPTHTTRLVGKPATRIQLVSCTSARISITPAPLYVCHSAKKSFPLSSTTMNAGKFSTSIFHTASIPSSSYSSTSTFLMQFCASTAAGPPMDPR